MLDFATTPSAPVVLRPGSQFDLSVHVHQDGANFHWTSATGGPYTPKASIRVGGTVLATATGTVVSAGGGTASFTWTSTTTATLPARAFGEVQLWADQNSGSENLQIGNVTFQTGEAIP
jgi:hypothetical protein